VEEEERDFHADDGVRNDQKKQMQKQDRISSTTTPATGASNYDTATSMTPRLPSNYNALPAWRWHQERG
ncbi:unnamed protein product, partial [Amoebophrya sp. A25]